MPKKKDENKGQNPSRPIEDFFHVLQDLKKNAPEFMDHLNRARVEALKAVKVLLDAKIEHLEKKSQPKPRKTARKITIE